MAIDNSIALKKKFSFTVDGEWQNETVEYEMKNNKVIVNASGFKRPNISSHVLVNLCGLNRFASVGATLLGTFGLLEKKEIPLYQSIKGNIVEEFANQYLEEIYGGRYDIESFTLSQFKNYNQFPDAKPFSGALDKLIHGKTKIPVEIKAKEMKDHRKIAINGNYPKDQVVQGANQAYMYGADNFMMLYGFLSPEISNMLKDVCKKFTTTVTEKNILGIEETKTVEETCWIWGENYAQAIEDLGLRYEDITFHHKIMDFDPRIIKAYRKKAQELYDDFYKTRTIDRWQFKKEELFDVMKYVKK